MAEHKHDCMFRNKAGVCTFKPEQCNSEDCSFYDLPFTQKDIKAQLEKVKKEMKEINNKYNISKAKDIKKEAEEHGQTERLNEVEQELRQFYDLKKGKEYLEKSLRFAKRAKL